MSPVPDQRNINQNPIEEVLQINGFVGPAVSSSDEEDTVDNGYQLLPQEPPNVLNDDEDSENETLSDLLAALNTHGVNNITREDDVVENLEQRQDQQEASTESASPVQEDERSISSTISKANNGHEQEYTKEQSLLWKISSSNQINLDEKKEQEIKRVMANITLPPSAVPCWARDISDDEWESKILTIRKQL